MDMEEKTFHPHTACEAKQCRFLAPSLVLSEGGERDGQHRHVHCLVGGERPIDAHSFRPIDKVGCHDNCQEQSQEDESVPPFCAGAHCAHSVVASTNEDENLCCPYQNEKGARESVSIESGGHWMPSSNAESYQCEFENLTHEIKFNPFQISEEKGWGSRNRSSSLIR